jgi:hypothetical protein
MTEHIGSATKTKNVILEMEKDNQKPDVKTQPM